MAPTVGLEDLERQPERPIETETQGLHQGAAGAAGLCVAEDAIGSQVEVGVVTQVALTPPVHIPLVRMLPSLLVKAVHQTAATHLVVPAPLVV